MFLPITFTYFLQNLETAHERQTVQRLVEHIFVFIQAVPKVPHFLKGASLEVSWSAEKYFLKVNIFYF
jgi:hypothetical protein